MRLVSSLRPRRVRQTAVFAAVVLVACAAVAEAKTVKRVIPVVHAAPTPMSGPQWSDNLLQGDQSSFDRSNGGWVGNTNTTAKKVPFPRQTGTGSLAIINSSAKFGTSWVSSGNGLTSYLPAEPGARYALNFYVLAGALNAGRGVAGQIGFIDANGREFEQATGQHKTDSSKAWTRVMDTVGIAPPNAAYLVIRALVYGVVPGETHFIDTVTLKRANGSSKALAGPLHTAGNKIFDANGNAVMLRGMVRYGMQTGPIAPGVTYDDISHAKTWGANVIRLPVGSQLWLDPSFNTCHTDPNYVSKVDNAVNTITGLGMFALIDLHWNGVQPCGPAHPWAMADARTAPAFWSQVATRYKNNPLVGFDLYNEPHNVDDNVWRYGGTVKDRGVTYQAAGMQQMYDAVRATGSTNLVFVTGNVWGNRFPGTAPLAGNNIVYSVHSYSCPGKAPPYCTNPTPYDGTQFLKNWVDAGQHYPVFVGEFGWPNPDSGTYNDSLIAYAEQQGWGWVVFTWGNKTGSRFRLIAEGAGTAYEPCPSGMPALETFPGT